MRYQMVCMVVSSSFAGEWDTFTIVFLWRFKPEHRNIQPIFDEEEEPLMALNSSSQEFLNDALQAWDMFLTSTEKINVLIYSKINLIATTMTLTSDFKFQWGI